MVYNNHWSFYVAPPPYFLSGPIYLCTNVPLGQCTFLPKVQKFGTLTRRERRDREGQGGWPGGNDKASKVHASGQGEESRSKTPVTERVPNRIIMKRNHRPCTTTSSSPGSTLSSGNNHPLLKIWARTLSLPGKKMRTRRMCGSFTKQAFLHPH